MKGKIIAFLIVASSVAAFASCTTVPGKMIGRDLGIPAPNATCDLPGNNLAYQCNVGGF